MADRWTQFLTHPATMMAAGIMAGSDPNQEGLGGVGQGIMAAGGVAADRAKMLQAQAQRERQRMNEAAFAQTLDPAQRLQFNVDPAAYMKSMYQRPSDFMLKMGYAGGDPERYRKLFGPASTNIALDLAEKRRNRADIISEEISSGIVEDVLSNARTAGADLEWAEQGLNYLRNLDTGRWAPLQAQAAAWLNLAPEFVGTSEAFTAHTGEAAMRQLQRTKGAVSDREMQFFTQELSPGLAKSREGNYILFELARRKAYRARDMRRYIGEYARMKDGDMAGFEDWYLKNKDPFPEFDVNQLMQQYQREILGREPVSPEVQERMTRQGLITP